MQDFPVFVEAIGVDQILQVVADRLQIIDAGLNVGDVGFEELVFGGQGIGSRRPFHLAGRKSSQRFTQALQQAIVIDDEAVGLAFLHAVGAGDGLHEGVALHRLVYVEGSQ